ncbi:hypothetical protein Dimus_016818 [Dionaea muscipula]
MEVVEMGNDSGGEEDYDRARKVTAFDETKAGVKGLVDSGVVSIPRFFIQPQAQAKEKVVELLFRPDASGVGVQIPVIDFGGGEGELVVDQVRRACEAWGFFQIVNHGIPIDVMEEMLAGIIRFHEQPTEVKSALYSRDVKKRVRFYSNGDLFTSKVASWRDSVSFDYHDSQLHPQELPLVCRKAVRDYMEHILELQQRLSRVLSTALGLTKDYLSSIECMKTATLVSHYYPACPQPDRTFGAKKHSDPSFLTILLQDNVGGLQVLHQDHWVDVLPTRGALLVNIGDLMQVVIHHHHSHYFLFYFTIHSSRLMNGVFMVSFQLITNDKFRSVEHRVLVRRTGPRVSAACFFYPSSEKRCKPFGPLQEFLSNHNPPLYREIAASEYLAYYRRKGLDGMQALPHFKL